MNKSLNLLSDQELLNKCKFNDERAFNALFDRYFKRLYTFGYGLIEDEDIAKEIAMDVMLRLWQKKGDLVVDHDALPYLFKSVKNATYNYWRKAKIITEPLEILEDNLENSSPSADSHMEFKEMEKTYESYLNSLPEQRRKIFYLSREENLSYAEIAEKLGLSVHTVRNQMSSSLHYLRKHLSNCNETTPLLIVVFLSFF